MKTARLIEAETVPGVPGSNPSVRRVYEVDPPLGGGHRLVVCLTIDIRWLKEFGGTDDSETLVLSWPDDLGDELDGGGRNTTDVDVLRDLGYRIVAPA